MLEYDGFIYNVVLVAHLLAVIVAVGSSFVWAAFSARARSMEPRDAHVINTNVLKLSTGMTSYPFYAAGATGTLLVLMTTIEDGPWAFDQTWISLAFLLFIAAVLVALFLHKPNLKAIDQLEATLLAGGGTPGQAGGPPAEVVELEERGKQAAMYGGILHLLSLLLVIIMVWRPGAPFGV